MRRTVSLSEFMPYGAPELLAAGRPHLALALTISSALAVTLFAAALGLLPFKTIIPPPRIELPDDPHCPLPPQSVIVIPVAEHTIVPSARPDVGIVVPVADDLKAPAWNDLPSASSSDDHGKNGIEIASPGTSSPPATPERLPEFGVYVPVDELPEAVMEYKPPYPDLARQAGVEGLVIVHALVGKDGRVVQVRLEPKFSIPLLDETALDAARRWVFKPAFANGHPVAVWFAIPFHFVLNE